LLPLISERNCAGRAVQCETGNDEIGACGSKTLPLKSTSEQSLPAALPVEEHLHGHHAAQAAVGNAHRRRLATGDRRWDIVEHLELAIVLE
jgi:hypothetical protein